ncbi:MAG: hypothetical protein U0796_04175 [Gemmatales bacterium]
MPLGFGSLVQFDASKIDKTRLRQWLVEGAMLLEPAIITPSNLDKLLFDQLDTLFQRIIESITREEGALVVGQSGEMLFAGERPPTMAEVSQYLANFPGASEAAREMIRESPALLRRLQRFTRSDQELIMSSPLLLMALQMLLPMLFQLLLNRFRT